MPPPGSGCSKGPERRMTTKGTWELVSFLVCIMLYCDAEVFLPKFPLAEVSYLS